MDDIKSKAGYVVIIHNLVLADVTAEEQAILPQRHQGVRILDR